MGVAYPTLESFKAIETVRAADDTQVRAVRCCRLHLAANPLPEALTPSLTPLFIQWLSYWVVYFTYATVEKFVWPVLRW